MTTTRLLIINTADVEKAVRKIIKKHSKYYENKDAQIDDYDVHSQTGQVFRLTYSSGDIVNELSKIDEIKLICFTLDGKYYDYSFFGKLKPNSFNATVWVSAGIVVKKKLAKQLRKLAFDDDRVEVTRFFWAAVRDKDDEYISYTVNLFINDVGFIDIMNGIDFISAELEKTNYDDFWAVWFRENDGSGHTEERGELGWEGPFGGPNARLAYTKSDGTLWQAISDSEEIIDGYDAPLESTAEGGRF